MSYRRTLRCRVERFTINAAIYIIYVLGVAYMIGIALIPFIVLYLLFRMIVG